MVWAFVALWFLNVALTARNVSRKRWGWAVAYGLTSTYCAALLVAEYVMAQAS